MIYDIYCYRKEVIKILESLGIYLTNIGIKLLPYSFVMYLPVRYLEYKWNKGYNKLVKSIWYLVLGLTYITKNIDSNIIVMYICFIESFDLFIQQKEINKIRK